MAANVSAAYSRVRAIPPHPRYTPRNGSSEGTEVMLLMSRGNQASVNGCVARSSMEMTLGVVFARLDIRLF